MSIRFRRRWLIALFAGLSLVGAGSSAQALTTFTFSNGDRAGQVDFTISGGNMTIQLTNTYAGDTLDAAHLLNAVFFNVGVASPTYTLGTVTIAPGSDAYYYPTASQPVQPTNDDVSGEWAFKGGISDSNVSGANFGLSSTGLGVFGPGDVFNTSLNLAGPSDPDGPQFGLLSAGDDTTTGAPGNILNGGGAVKNSIIATFSNVNFLESDLSNVWFKYGTSFDEPQYPASTTGGTTTGEATTGGTTTGEATTGGTTTGEATTGGTTTGEATTGGTTTGEATTGGTTTGEATTGGTTTGEFTTGGTTTGEFTTGESTTGGPAPEPDVVPEPATAALAVMGLGALAVAASRRRQRN